MKQTAVQMVFSDLESKYPSIFNMFTQEGRDFVNHFHKYLAVEKEQMEDIYIGHNQYNDEYETFEQYYKETFKSE